MNNTEVNKFKGDNLNEKNIQDLKKNIKREKMNDNLYELFNLSKKHQSMESFRVFQTPFSRIKIFRNNTELNYFKNDNLNELFNCDIILYISIGNHDTSTPRRHIFLRRVPGTPPLCCQLPQLYRGDLHTPTEHEQNSRNEIDLLFFLWWNTFLHQ